jgi:hypothetical protein
VIRAALRPRRWRESPGITAHHCRDPAQRTSKCVCSSLRTPRQVQPCALCLQDTSVNAHCSWCCRQSRAHTLAAMQPAFVHDSECCASSARSAASGAWHVAASAHRVTAQRGHSASAHSFGCTASMLATTARQIGQRPRVGAWPGGASTLRRQLLQNEWRHGVRTGSCCTASWQTAQSQCGGADARNTSETPGAASPSPSGLRRLSSRKCPGPRKEGADVAAPSPPLPPAVAALSMVASRRKRRSRQRRSAEASVTDATRQRAQAPQRRGRNTCRTPYALARVVPTVARSNE